MAPNHQGTVFTPNNVAFDFHSPLGFYKFKATTWGEACDQEDDEYSIIHYNIVPGPMVPRGCTCLGQKITETLFHAAHGQGILGSVTPNSWASTSTNFSLSILRRKLARDQQAPGRLDIGRHWLGFEASVQRLNILMDGLMTFSMHEHPWSSGYDVSVTR